MPNRQVSWNVNTLIEGAPAVSLSHSHPAEAVALVDFQVPKNSTVKKDLLQLQDNEAVLLIVKLKDDYPNKVTYKIKAKGPFELSTPHFIAGGALKMLGVNPTEIEVINGHDQDISVQVVVARKVT